MKVLMILSQNNRKGKGKGISRPKAEIPEDFLKEYRDYKSGKYGDITAAKFAEMIGIGRSTLYKYVKQLETEHIEPI